MRIVLNQKTLAEKMISSHKPGDGVGLRESLRLLARYYYSQGMKRREIRKKLEEFLLECRPDTSVVKWMGWLDRTVRCVDKYPILDIDSIPVTQPEMERIDSLPTERLRRLAFTLLCVAKYRLAENEKADGWVSTPDSKIMSMANIRASVRDQDMRFGRLIEAGIIEQATRIDNTNERVVIFEDGEPVIKIRDFRNLGYQYQMYHGTPCYVCVECGLTCKIKSKHPNKSHPKYCRECSDRVHAAQMKASAARRRGQGKS